MTEIDRLRTRLRRCEQQLAVSWDHAPVGMVIVDNDNCIVRVNAAFCQFLGYERDQLVGRDWRQLTHPDDVAVGAADIAALFAGERSSFAVEKRYLRADGRSVWAQVNVALLRDDDGAPLFRLAQLIDISERREREQHLQQVADTQRAAADKLHRLDEMKNYFLDAVSHELRTPLTVIRGMAEILQAQRADLEPEVRIRLEDALVTQTHRLGELLEDLTELKRLTQGQAAYEPEHLDAVKAIGDILETSAVAPRTHLEAPDELVVHADLHHLQLIARNLLSNVEKYAPDDQVTVRVTPLPDGGLRLDVIDRGPGIAVDERQAVFEPFYRAAVHHPRPGTGIGLSLVSSSAALHGGQAWVEDTEVGTHIAVTLPDRPSAFAAQNAGRAVAATDRYR